MLLLLFLRSSLVKKKKVWKEKIKWCEEFSFCCLFFVVHFLYKVLILGIDLFWLFFIWEIVGKIWNEIKSGDIFSLMVLFSRLISFLFYFYFINFSVPFFLLTLSVCLSSSLSFFVKVVYFFVCLCKRHFKYIVYVGAHSTQLYIFFNTIYMPFYQY